MEFDPNKATREKLEAFFVKVEAVLAENFEVINKLLVPKIKEDVI